MLVSPDGEQRRSAERAVDAAQGHLRQIARERPAASRRPPSACARRCSALDRQTRDLADLRAHVDDADVEVVVRRCRVTVLLEYRAPVMGGAAVALTSLRVPLANISVQPTRGGVIVNNSNHFYFIAEDTAQVTTIGCFNLIWTIHDITLSAPTAKCGPPVRSLADRASSLRRSRDSLAPEQPVSRAAASTSEGQSRRAAACRRQDAFVDVEREARARDDRTRSDSGSRAAAQSRSLACRAGGCRSSTRTMRSQHGGAASTRRGNPSGCSDRSSRRRGPAGS